MYMCIYIHTPISWTDIHEISTNVINQSSLNLLFNSCLCSSLTRIFPRIYKLNFSPLFLSILSLSLPLSLSLSLSFSPSTSDILLLKYFPTSAQHSSIDFLFRIKREEILGFGCQVPDVDFACPNLCSFPFCSGILANNSVPVVF